MEVVNCKVLLSHYCTWKEGNQIHVEDVGGSRILSVFKKQLAWFLEVVSDLLRGPEDKFFQKLCDVDIGRLKVSKFKAKNGWVLNCDFWPASGGHSNLRVCFRGKQTTMEVVPQHARKFP